MIKNLQALVISRDDIPKYNTEHIFLEKNNLKNISCVVFPSNGSNPSFIKFLDNFIYEFKIDFYKTGKFDDNGFYDYCKIQYDSKNNNYKIYSYYFDKGKYNPTKPNKDGEYDVIEFLSADNGIIKFKGPVFTEGFRKGSYDEWILNTEIMFSY